MFPITWCAGNGTRNSLPAVCPENATPQTATAATNATTTISLESFMVHLADFATAQRAPNPCAKPWPQPAAATSSPPETETPGSPPAPAAQKLPAYTAPQSASPLRPPATTQSAARP